MIEAVVIVVLVFLQGWRPAIIPIIAIPVSLVGTFAVMAALGFSINNLTLFGLVLAVGIVVDDAIVVVENVERHLRDGMTRRDAALKTMEEVGSALVSIALVLLIAFRGDARRTLVPLVPLLLPAGPPVGRRSGFMPARARPWWSSIRSAGPRPGGPGERRNGLGCGRRVHFPYAPDFRKASRAEV